MKHFLKLVMDGQFPGAPDADTVEITDAEYDEVRSKFFRSSEKPKIYLFAEKGGILGYSAFALAEDGNCLAWHDSSSIEWAQHDIGLTSKWKRDTYDKYYPNGYELVWIDLPSKDEGWSAALKKNEKKVRHKKIKAMYDEFTHASGENVYPLAIALAALVPSLLEDAK